MTLASSALVGPSAPAKPFADALQTEAFGWVGRAGSPSPPTPAVPDPPVEVPAERLRRFVADSGPWAPVTFIALFVVACVCCLPVVFFTLASGALFGIGWGFAYSWIAAQIGASAAFYISRRLAHGWVARRLAGRPLLSAIDEAVGIEGWKIVGLVRLAPGSPFFLLNYLFGLTRVRYRDYVLATAVSIVPGTLLFVYLGSLGQMAASGRLRTIWDWILYGVGLVAILFACVLIARRARQLLRRRVHKVAVAAPVREN